MICNLLFLCLFAFSNSSFLSKRCFPLTNPGTLQPPAPVGPVQPPPQPPVAVLPPPQPPVAVLPPRPPVAPINPQVETGNPNQPLRNGACFYMVNVQNGQAVSHGREFHSIEIGLSNNRTPDEVVCVEQGPNNAYFIHWKVFWNHVFDIYGGGNADGVRLIKYPKHGGANQQFRFVRNNLGQYQFVAVNSGKAFGLWSGTPVAQSTLNPGNTAQLWNLIPEAAVQAVPVNTRFETGNPTQPLRNGACFYMVNVQNGQAVSHGREFHSIEIGLSNTRSPKEVVCVEQGPNNAYFIHWKVFWNHVFDIYGGGNADGVRLIKYPKHGGRNQQFRFVRNNLGQYQFVAVNSGKAFGLWSGTALAQSTPNANNLSQLWNLIPA